MMTAATLCTVMQCSILRHLICKEACANLHVMLSQDAYIRNPVLKSGLIFIIRFGNTFWGGAQWVQYAKLIGIQ